jgi:putative ABC transport system ATP-binding protein
LESLGIVFSQVSKVYRTGAGAEFQALAEVSVNIAAGQAVAIAGPSGSGKSTLLHLAGAMDSPDSGSIKVNNQQLESLRDDERAKFRRAVGFVFQRFHLLPALSALDNVIAPVLPYRTSFDKVAKAKELLASVGLSGRESDLPSHLSGGQQQRVAIARALINDPMLILADEPTGNLDSKTGAEIIDLLFGLHAERSVTMLLATHDSSLAARCDRTITLIDGRIHGDTSTA